MPRLFFFSSRRRHTRYWRDWSSDVCSSDLRLADRGAGCNDRGRTGDREAVMRIRSSEITPKSLYLRRREFLALCAAGAGALLFPAGARAAGTPHGRKLEGVKPGQPSTDEKKNSFDEITHYNNFYEFGTDKDDPARHASKLQTRPWAVKVEGECAKPQTFDIEELLKLPVEERVYRLRCVEAWSMVIPWDGI